MKKFLAFIAIFGMIGITQLISPTNSEARRSSGGFSSSRSSSKSYTKSSFTRNRGTKSAVKKQSPAQKEAAKKKAIAAQKQRQAKADKSAKTKFEAKRSKALAGKDKQAFSKYKTKADAEKAYRSSLPKNSYTSKTAPTTRPSYIPQNQLVGGKTVNVTYNSYGGGYGYGYIHPTTGLFTQLIIADMILDRNHMRSQGFGQWNANGTPLYASDYSRGPSGLAIFMWILIAIILIGFIGSIMSSNRGDY